MTSTDHESSLDPPLWLSWRAVSLSSRQRAGRGKPRSPVPCVNASAIDPPTPPASRGSSPKGARFPRLRAAAARCTKEFHYHHQASSPVQPRNGRPLATANRAICSHRLLQGRTGRSGRGDGIPDDPWVLDGLVRVGLVFSHRQAEGNEVACSVIPCAEWAPWKLASGSWYDEKWRDLALSTQDGVRHVSRCEIVESHSM